MATSDGSHSMRLYFNQVWRCTCSAFLEVHPRKETFSVSFSFFPSSSPWQIHGHPRAVNAYCIIQNLAQIFRERSSFTLSTELRYSFVLFFPSYSPPNLFVRFPEERGNCLTSLLIPLHSPFFLLFIFFLLSGFSRILF